MAPQTGARPGPPLLGADAEQVATIVVAVTEFHATGGLVVVTAGPGAGVSHALRSVAANCRAFGWHVLDATDELAHPPVSAGFGNDLPVAIADEGRHPTGLADRAVVVAGATDGLPWPDALRSEAGDLLDESRLRVVRLPRLAGGTVASIIRAAAPDRPDAEVERLTLAAGGNPLVATHLARHGHLLAPDLDGVLVSRLLDRYGTAARTVAAALAVLRSVTLDELVLLADVCELSVATVARQFDFLVEAGVVGPVRAGSGFAVSIPWLADALYATLGPATRDHIHGAAADALWERGTVRDDLVAHHLLRSAPGGDAAIDRILAVADRLSAGSPEVAVECYRRALTQLTGPPERVAELTARLARASLLAGRPEETVAVGRALLDDPSADAVEVTPWLLPVVTEAMKAISAVEEAESILRTSAGGVDELLDTQAAYLFAASGRDAEAQARIRRSRGSLAKRSVRGQVNMLSNLLHAQCIAGNFADLHEDATLLAGILDQAPEEARLHGWATLAHVWSVEGDLASTARAASYAEDLLRGETWGIYVPGVRYARAAAGFADGHWDNALRIATDADGPLAQSGTVSYLYLMRHIRARILANRGEFTDARRVGGTPASGPRFITAMRTLAAAEIEILEGNVEAGAGLLTACLDQDRLAGEVRAGLLAMLASAAAARGDGGTVRECFDEVDHRAGIAAASRQVRLELRLARARAESRAELAREVLREAREHGFALFEARALLTLGCLEVDPEANLTAAMRVFGDLNAVPWRRATATELRERGLRVPRRPRTNADSLTETEVQLARLVQAARSNKEIAEVMSLSVKTVEVYLSRLYFKAGCKNRLDLARAADEGRLALG